MTGYPLIRIRGSVNAGISVFLDPVNTMEPTKVRF
jgi:hypothetical protein